MARSEWTNVRTGRRMNNEELRVARLHAHRLLQGDQLMFDDETDALSALGVVELASVSV